MNMPLPSPPDKARLPFVGRHQYRRWLDERVQEMLAGHPRVVFIAGKAGIGKTRFLKEWQSQVPQDRLTISYHRCYQDLAAPYLPFIATLDTLLARLPVAVESILHEDLPIIRQFLQRGGAPLVHDDPLVSSQSNWGKLQVFLAVSRMLLTLAQHVPTLCVLEDMHWADTASLELFQHLGMAMADSIDTPLRLGLIATYRPEERGERLQHLLARLQREAVCQHIELPALDDTECHELLGHICHGRPSPHLVTTLRNTTQGNPLFLQEIFHHLLQQEVLQEQEGYVSIPPTTALRLPPELTSAIQTRLHTLSSRCQDVLALAAVIGERFTVMTLSAISALSAEDLEDVLAEGLRHHLLAVDEHDEHTLYFAHPLIWHTCYHAILRSRRQRLHGQLADILKQTHAATLVEHVSAIAHHLIRAGSDAAVDRVVYYASWAAEQAYAVSAWDSAATLYEAALTVAQTPDSLSPENRAKLHYLAGLAYQRYNDFGPCLHHYEQALMLSRACGDIRRVAQVLMQQLLVRSNLAGVSYDTLVDIQPLLDVLQALGEEEPALRGQIAASLSRVYWSARMPDQAQEMAQYALAIGRQLPDHQLCAWAFGGLGLAQIQHLDVRDALESYQQSLAAAQQTNDLWSQGWALQRLPLAFAFQGRFQEAEASAYEARAWTRKTHSWGEYSLALGALVMVAVAKGQFEAAEAHMEEILGIVHRTHYPFGASVALVTIACAHTWRGHWHEAERALDLRIEPGRIFRHIGAAHKTDTDVYRRLIHAYATAEPSGDLGDHSTLEGVACDATFLAPYCALIDMAASPSHLPPRPALYNAIVHAEARGMLFPRGWVFLLPRVLGVAATRYQWWDEAAAHFQRAIERATYMGALPELGRTYLDYAHMLLCQGDMAHYGHARALTKHALSLFQELHMPPFAQRARQQLDTLHTSEFLPTQHDPAFLDTPTPREAAALTQLAKRYTRFLG